MTKRVYNLVVVQEKTYNNKFKNWLNVIICPYFNKNYENKLYKIVPIKDALFHFFRKKVSLISYMHNIYILNRNAQWKRAF